MGKIDSAAVQKAMEAKLEQLTDYRKSLSERDDDVGKHARAVADGRLLQLEQDMALIALQPSV